MKVLLSACAITLLCAQGCVPTDSGNPPAALDGSHIAGTVVIGVSETTLAIRGSAGAVTPAGADVFVIDFSGTLPVAHAQSAADGSFALPPLQVGTGDHLRLWVDTAAGRASPVDVSPTSDGITSDASTLPSCIKMTPAVHLELFGVAASAQNEVVAVENTCTTSVSFSSVRVRDAASSFSIVGSVPTVLAPGEHAELEVQASASSTSMIDGLIFESDSPTAGWRAVTLFGEP